MLQAEKVGRVTSLEMIQRVYQFLLKIEMPQLWQQLYSEEAIEQRKQEEKKRKKEKSWMPSVYEYGHLMGRSHYLQHTTLALGCIKNGPCRS